MKALSLIQPWASLVAIGAKKIETRSWNTSYRGPLAIHVSKTKPQDVGLMWKEPWQSAFVEAGLLTIGPGKLLGMDSTEYQFHPERYHLGYVIATCILVSTDRFGEWIDREPMIWRKGNIYFELNDTERAFGDFSIGRFGWFLANVKLLPEPIPARGFPGLWEWKGA